MGHRLSKIYTRTGDDGTTGLGDGQRVQKHDLRVDAYGTVDELNSQIGVMIAHGLPRSLQALMSQIQHELFDLGSELSVPGFQAIHADHITALEHWLDHFNQQLPPLKEFILPGGTLMAAQCHVARTVCRRAERICSELSEAQAINASALSYLNRLSDLFFVVARVLARQEGGLEVLWKPRQSTLLPPNESSS